MVRVAYGACLASGILGFTSATALAVGIGTVTDVVNEAYRTPPGATELPASVEDALVADEVLRTGENSAISVRFVDGSELSVEAASEVVLSDYVFDTQTASSSGGIELNSGLFHFNSNGATDSGVALVTPVATIGIRGTEFLVTVGEGITVVDILDGEVEVMPRRGGRAARCIGGQSALVAAADTDAVCGDFGSFSTAAGLPPAPTVVAAGESNPNGLGSRPEPPEPPAKPDPEPEPEPEPEPPAKGNHSGHGDGTNPGRGHDNGNGNHGGNNGGEHNPGGEKK